MSMTGPWHTRGFEAPRVRRAQPLRLCLCAALLTVSGCAQIAQIKPQVPQSEGHITAPRAAEVEIDRTIPPPARSTAFVPPPKPAVRPQTYSVVVNEVPAKELLLALSRDTKQNIDIHPALTGVVSLNAINEPLTAILDRMSKQVDLRYRMEGNTIVVTPDTPYSHTYRVDYVNMIRNTSSAIGVSGQVAGGQQGSQQSQGSSQSASSVTTTTTNDFWQILQKTVQSILRSAQLQSREARAEQLSLLQAEQKIRLQEAIANSVARGSQSGSPTAGAAVAAAVPGETRPQTTAQSVSEDVIVNPIAGTLTVFGTDAQHKLIQNYLTQVQSAAQRQVLIEATIVEVRLSEAYQGGINWSRVFPGSGFSIAQTLLGGFTGAATAAGATAGNAITFGYQRNNTTSTIQLLQEFGATRVLSSPKLLAINNQTALLKVVDNIVYFEIKADTSTSNTGPSLTTFNTTAKTVSVGMVMGVTPQISDDDRVSLTVRPTISRVLRFRNDPNPSLCDAARTTCIASPVPEVQVREMESVLQVGSGQTIIMGGLMQDDLQRDREQLPGADKLGDAGELLRFRNERSSKTELVIFIRPTVVKHPSIESDDLKFFQRFLPQAGQATSSTGTASTTR